MDSNISPKEATVFSTALVCASINPPTSFDVFITSSATTAKLLPASPALVASIYQ